MTTAALVLQARHAPFTATPGRWQDSEIPTAECTARTGTLPPADGTYLLDLDDVSDTAVQATVTATRPAWCEDAPRDRSLTGYALVYVTVDVPDRDRGEQAAHVAVRNAIRAAAHAWPACQPIAFWPDAAVVGDAFLAYGVSLPGPGERAVLVADASALVPA